MKVTVGEIQGEAFFYCMDTGQLVYPAWQEIIDAILAAYERGILGKGITNAQTQNDI